MQCATHAITTLLALFLLLLCGPSSATRHGPSFGPQHTYSHSRHLTQAPAGNYAAVDTIDKLIILARLPKPADKFARLNSSSTVLDFLGAGLHVAANTSLTLDCAGRALDASEVGMFNAAAGSELTLYNCTGFMPPYDFLWAKTGRVLHSTLLYDCEAPDPNIRKLFEGSHELRFGTSLPAVGLALVNSTLQCLAPSEYRAALALAAGSAPASGGHLPVWLVIVPIAGGLAIVILLVWLCHHRPRKRTEPVQGSYYTVPPPQQVALQQAAATLDPLKMHPSSLVIKSNPTSQSRGKRRFHSASRSVQTLASSTGEERAKRPKPPRASSPFAMSCLPPPPQPPPSDVRLELSSLTPPHKSPNGDSAIEESELVRNGTVELPLPFRESWLNRPVSSFDEASELQPESGFPRSRLPRTPSEEAAFALWNGGVPTRGDAETGGGGYCEVGEQQPASCQSAAALRSPTPQSNGVYGAWERQRGGVEGRTVTLRHLIAAGAFDDNPAKGKNLKRLLSLVRQIAGDLAERRRAGFERPHGALCPEAIVMDLPEGHVLGAGHRTLRHAFRSGLFAARVVSEPVDEHGCPGTDSYAPIEDSTMYLLHEGTPSVTNDVARFGILLWELYPPDATSSEAYPFPNLPPSAPLNYSFLLVSCLTSEEHERPTFIDVLSVISDLKNEIQTGNYMDLSGSTVACGLLR